jgi:hypothetical protein
MGNGVGHFPKQGQPDLDPPATDNHMQNFDRAMKDALDGWDKDENQEFVVTFSVKAKKLHNPGGIKQYKVTIGP